jgi:hypothetical protein
MGDLQNKTRTLHAIDIMQSIALMGKQDRQLNFKNVRKIFLNPYILARKITVT